MDQLHSLYTCFVDKGMVGVLLLALNDNSTPVM